MHAELWWGNLLEGWEGGCSETLRWMLEGSVTRIVGELNRLTLSVEKL